MVRRSLARLRARYGRRTDALAAWGLAAGVVAFGLLNTYVLAFGHTGPVTDRVRTAWFGLLAVGVLVLVVTGRGAGS